jgi:NAD(P)-dependent dehydrogenase (short-subunit alcohol dehydrogenase family)
MIEFKKLVKTDSQLESDMIPEPESIRSDYIGSSKLKGKVALISGGDSGIGRSAAIHFSKEGADVAIIYHKNHSDAEETKERIEKENRKCLLLAGDVGNPLFCEDAVAATLFQLGKIDILVNNAAEQHPCRGIEEITLAQLESTFRTNIYSYFFLTQAALPHLLPGSSIINTSSVVAYKGSAHLIDYSATKGAIVAFTRSLAHSLIDRGIRVNGVAPGPVWTPLIPSTFTAEEVESFGEHYPMKRAAQPSEIGPSYVFLASEDSSFITGQFLHPNGGLAFS